MGNGGEVNVSREALLEQATAWDNDSMTMSQMSWAAAGLAFPGFSGIFSPAIGPYNQLCWITSGQCRQGDQAMEKIAGALTKAYQRYGATEQHITQISERATPEERL
jgi:hypothetical protein